MRFSIRALVMVSLLAAAGCAKSSRKATPGVATIAIHPAQDSSPSVATFGNWKLSTKQVAGWFEKMPAPTRARFRSPQAREQFVRQRIQLDLLADAALKDGLQNSPEVTSAVKRALANALLRKTLTAVPEPTDAAVQAYYKQHAAEFDRPPRIRLGEIFLAAPKSDAKARAHAHVTAKHLVAKLRKLGPHDVKGFSKLVHAYSKDPRTVGMNGELRYLTAEQLTQRFGPAVAKAGTDLQKPGAVSNPVEDAKGIYLFRLLDRSEGSHPTLEQMRRVIVHRLEYQNRRDARTALIDKLTKAASLKIDSAALSKLPVDFGPPGRASMPRPMMLPHRVPPPAARAASGHAAPSASAPKGGLPAAREDAR